MVGKKILVTGADGFTGRHFVAQCLLAGFEIFGFGKGTAYDSSVKGQLRFSDVNLLDVPRLTKAVCGFAPDYVVHLAAVSHVEHGCLNSLYSTNIAGTFNLLDVLVQSRVVVEKVLIASSANIYGTAEVLPLTEQSQPSPVNDYGVSKYAMEMGAELRSKDLPIVVARPFNYTGRGQAESFLVPKIVAAFKSGGDHLLLGNLNVARDFSDVRDVVFAYLRLLQVPSALGVFNVSSGASVKLFDILDMVSNLSSHSLKVVSSDDLVRRNEIMDIYGDSAKLKAAIGEFRNHSMYDTLNWMIN